VKAFVMNQLHQVGFIEKPMPKPAGCPFSKLDSRGFIGGFDRLRIKF
jgi:hypothetical protein